MAPRDPFDPRDDPGDEPEESQVTARPTGREASELRDEDGEKIVPQSNVGGAAPTLGHDSGGALPEEKGDLASLTEPEAPASPEGSAVHVRREEPEQE